MGFGHGERINNIPIKDDFNANRSPMRVRRGDNIPNEKEPSHRWRERASLSLHPS